MRKYLKSAILLEVLVLASALAFLLAFLRFGLGRNHPLLNIILMLSCVVIVGVLLLVLWQRTLQREILVRRFYLSPDWIYNHEIGYAQLSRIIPDGNAYDFVTFAAEALGHKPYGFEVADTPESFEPRLIIESTTFLFHTTDDEDDPDGVVVDTWEGIVREIVDAGKGEQEYHDLTEFSNAGELARALMAYAAAGTDTDEELPIR